MEDKEKSADNSNEKAPVTEEKQKLSSTVKGRHESQEKKEPGKLPDDEFGVDHHSDPVISKIQ